MSDTVASACVERIREVATFARSKFVSVCFCSVSVGLCVDQRHTIVLENPIVYAVLLSVNNIFTVAGMDHITFGIVAGMLISVVGAHVAIDLVDQTG